MDLERAGEKRLTPRIHVPVYVATFSGAFRLGMLINLSTQGIFVQTTEPKEVGTQMELRFTLPDSQEPIRLSAEVMWVNYPLTHQASQLAQTGLPVHDNPGMGLRILAFHSNSRAALEAFIERTSKTRSA